MHEFTLWCHVVFWGLGRHFCLSEDSFLGWQKTEREENFSCPVHCKIVPLLRASADGCATRIWSLPAGPLIASDDA